VIKVGGDKVPIQEHSLMDLLRPSIKDRAEMLLALQLGTDEEIKRALEAKYGWLERNRDLVLYAARKRGLI
jgi:hypothetical protein